MHNLDIKNYSDGCWQRLYSVHGFVGLVALYSRRKVEGMMRINDVLIAQLRSPAEDQL